MNPNLRRHAVFAGLIILGLGAAHVGSAQLFQPIYYAGAPISLMDVSADGSIAVGFAQTPTTSVMWWSQATGVVLLHSAISPTANAISGDGNTFVGGVLTAYRYRRDTQVFEALATLPDSRTNAAALAVSRDGAVAAGFSFTLNGMEAVRWDADGSIVGLGFLPGAVAARSYATGISPDGSVIVGGASSATGERPFRWTESSGMTAVQDPSGRFFVTDAYAVSDGAHVIVGSALGPSGRVAVLWKSDGGVLPLGELPEARALDISSDGTRIVGTWSPESGITAGFLWGPELGQVDLLTYLQGRSDAPAGLAGWDLWPRAISGDGRVIAGTARDPSGKRQGFLVYLTSVPEPSAWGVVPASVLAAFVASRFLQRRRR